ncbi:MAG: alpha-E domain-containing protein [Candidatus Dormibacteraeota bacterium]|nr:alpha-E domain-containing protein [Candidatus Dormibacteraeota bacterium]
MLSRAATSLTLLGRHLERADHLARILGVHVALSLDRTDEPGPEFWNRFMELAGWPAGDTKSRDQAVEVVITGSLGPSVRASVAAARLAAQAVRPSLPSELYEQVNALNWRVQEPTWEPDLYPFLTDVQLSIRLVDGLLMDTMQLGEARDFVRLGKFLERTSNVTAIVTRKSAELADAPEDVLEWSAVLKSCFAFESYQSRYSGGVTPEHVIECLLLDPTLPRSARFSAQVALDSVSRIDGPGRRSKPKRLLSRLHRMFLDPGAQLVAHEPREFETEFRGMLRQLELAMRETYFHPSKVPANVIGEEGRAMPQQQQQWQQSAAPTLGAAPARR